MTWHTVKEAAPLLGISEETTYRICQSGRLAHRRVGLKPGRGKIQVSDEGIAAFLASCEIAAASPKAPPAREGKRKAATFSGRPDGKPFKYDW